MIKLGPAASDLAALGITNQRETTVVWTSKTGRPYYNAIVWQDTRTDRIARALEREGKGVVARTVPRCCAERVPQAGADGYYGAFNSRHLTADRTGLHVSKIEHLLGRYGSLSSELLDLIAERPELGEPLASAREYLKAEIYYAASQEGALHLDDVLTRRTRISIEAPDRADAAAAEVADLIAPPLGPDAGAGPPRSRALPVARQGLTRISGAAR